jgi:predicted Rossmann-fold nucleotide-binding protein
MRHMGSRASVDRPVTRLLICGGRESISSAVFCWLERNAERVVPSPIEVVIHGGARGADRAAGEWALKRGIPIQRFPADWDRYGKAAGHLRNTQMLVEGNPDLVIAFPGGVGTADMVRQAGEHGVKVHRVYRRD